MNIATFPPSCGVPIGRPGDGEGSVQVNMDPKVRIGTAKVRRLRQGRHRQEHDLLEPQVAFSKLGKRVLQIGCDPKHDSPSR